MILNLFSFIIFVLFLINNLLNAETGVKDVTTDEFQLDCLLTHNQLRDKHCSVHLKYSPQLKSLAIKRATQLSAIDGNGLMKKLNPAFGENILRVKYNISAPIQCKQAVNQWYKERVYYNWKRPKLTRTSRHFRQLIWNSTQRIGCASLVFDTSATFAWIVCTYHNVVPLATNVTQNLISVKKCDQILSIRNKFKTKVLTNGKWVQECITEHNKVRKQHSVSPLAINDAIFQTTQKRAVDMARKGFRFFRHKNSEFGENIHWTSSGHLNGTDQTISCKQSIDKWYGEVKNYDWDFRESHNGTVRHFIQLVWGPTTTVGCAQVQNIDGPKGGVYTVCLYNPKADFKDEERQWENVFPDYNIIKEVQTVNPVTSKAHDYEHIDELDDETELEKEFKDVDDIIDTRDSVQRQTPAISLEDMFIKTTTPNGFARNEYIHKKNG